MNLKHALACKRGIPPPYDSAAPWTLGEEK